MLTLGFICIILGWAMQFVGLLQGEKEISWVFVSSYAVGVFLIVTAGYLTGDMTTSNLNLLTLILSLCVLLMLVNGKKSAKRKR